jgi:NmrA-like family
MSIKIVAVAGSTGLLGGFIVKRLVSSGFDVTVLIRNDSKTDSLPTQVKKRTVDYTSHKSLISALQGIDAIVSLLNGPGLDFQPAIVEAAIETGVSRFLPSEFGANTFNPQAAEIPIFKGKVAFQEYLKAKVDQNPTFSYSLIIHGPLFDICLSEGLLCDVKNRQMTIYDGGDNRFSTTCVTDLGTVVSGVLKHPEETKNRAIFVEGASLTQKELLHIVEKVTGDKWSTTDEKVSYLNESMLAELKKEQPDASIFIPGFLRVAIFGGSAYGSNLREGTPGVDNDTLGLVAYTKDDLEERTRKIVA